MLKYINHETLKTMMESLKGSKIVTFEASSNIDKEMKKRDNPYIGIKKVQRVNGMVGYIYENALINRHAKEGTEFTGEVKQHPWGDMNFNHTLRINRKSGEPHLSIYVKNSVWVRYFMPDGTEISKEALKPYLYAREEGSSTQDGIEEKVVVRDFKLSNIYAFKTDGNVYITGTVPVEVAAGVEV